MVEEIADVIINARNVVSRRVRNRDRILTTVMWVLYAYLWLPLISLGAWYLGVRFAYDLVLRAGGTEPLISLLLSFLLILLITTLVVIFWSWMQRARFAKHERRLSSPELAPASERAFWGITESDHDQIRSGRRLLIGLDDSGNLKSIDG